MNNYIKSIEFDSNMVIVKRRICLIYTSNPYVVCGAPGQAGYDDKIGAKARLSRPYQGVFVKNPERCV